jgi:hypothetical protein
MTATPARLAAAPGVAAGLCRQALRRPAPIPRRLSPPRQPADA